MSDEQEVEATEVEATPVVEPVAEEAAEKAKE